MDRFPYSSAEFKRVKSIQFGILSPEELVRAGGPHLVCSLGVVRMP